MSSTWRARAYELLDEDAPRGRARLFIKALLIAAILAGTAAPLLETVEPFDHDFRLLLRVLDGLAVALLTIEYAVRLWAAPEAALSTQSPTQARLRYARSPFGLIDLLAILPFYIAVLLPTDPEWLSFLYLLRVLKIARYTPALGLFVAVLRAESSALLSTVMVLAVLLVLESAIMYALERDAQPAIFSSIPAAMWWGIVTITSVGYGDLAPITPWGRLFAGGVMSLGVAAFALPAGILATGFANELRRRDFLVSWRTVARLPLFATL